MAAATTDIPDLEKLLTLLGRSGFSDDEFLRDALWLGQFLRSGVNMDSPREVEEIQRQKRDEPKLEEVPKKEDKPQERKPVEPPQVKDPISSPQPLPPDAPGYLYPSIDKPNEAGRKATAIYVPASGTLPQPLELARALRPFQQKFRSRRLARLDVAATVEATAERRSVTPVLVREKERWFSLFLLVDSAPSMAVWRKTASELTRFLGALGIFRDVRSWTVDEDLRFHSQSGQAATPKQLADPSGRTLIVVLTNGVGRHWQSREMAQWLSDWGRKGPAGICSLLPPMRWQHTDLGPAYLWTRASSAGAGNRLLTAGEGPRTVRLKDDATVFPVFPLTRRGLEEWAAMQMSRRETKTAALPISPTWFPPMHEVAAEPAPEVGVAQRVAEFRSFASPQAARLLEIFSAIPLSLPVMRLAQHTMMPESPLSAMAEVLMSGLVAPSKDMAANADPEEMLFDFSPEAREYLRDRTSVADLEKIHHEVRGAVREYIERRAGVSVTDFEAWVDDPEGMRDLPSDVKHFAQVTAETLRALGYSKRAKPPDAPAVFIMWESEEVQDLALEVAAGLRKRGVRVAMDGTDEMPARGWVLLVAATAAAVEVTPPHLTRTIARILESGLASVALVRRGVTPMPGSILFADSFSDSEKMVDAVIAEIAGANSNPAPVPKGAPPLDPERQIHLTPDLVGIDRMVGKGTVVLLKNDLFEPRPYVRDLIWSRDKRLAYSGGIQWLKEDEQPENRPGQLLIFEGPTERLTIPAGCSAIVLDPEFTVVLDLPDSVLTYEGDPEAIKGWASDRVEELQGILPKSVLEDVRYSPAMLSAAKLLTKEEKIWPAVRERYEEEWQRNKPTSVLRLTIHLVTTAFEALGPVLRDAAGILATLGEDAPRELVERLIPPERLKQLADFDLFDESTFKRTDDWPSLMRVSPHWAEWNARVLKELGIPGHFSPALLTSDAYIRRNAIYHLLQAGSWGSIEETIKVFECWAVRLKEDGWESLAQDIRSLPDHREIFRQVQALAKWLGNGAGLNREALAAAIAQYDGPLPQALRDSARAVGLVASTHGPERFVLLAGTRRSSPNKELEETTALAAKAIAREIAKQGLGLVCGAEYGSDSIAVSAFVEQRAAMGLDAGPALRIITDRYDPLPFEIPSATDVVRRSNQVSESVERAECVVLLGGHKRVLQVGRAGDSQAKRVFPVPATGGAAAGWFERRIPAGRLSHKTLWAQDLKTAEDAQRIAEALVHEIMRPAPQVARLEELSACRSVVVPAFVMKALGSRQEDQILMSEGLLFYFEKGDAHVVHETVHPIYHALSDPETHRRISLALEANPSDELSLRERLFHLIKANEREKAASVAMDMSWLIPAAEFADPNLLNELFALGLVDLGDDLRKTDLPVRARLGSSANMEIARAAIRFERAQTYVKVTGTGTHGLDDITRRAAEALGSTLAGAGFGLITSAYPGVDYVAASSYVKSGGKSLVHVMVDGSTDSFQEALALPEHAADPGGLKLSDGVVLLGGMGATMQIFEAARTLGKPIFPYRRTGGDASRAADLLEPKEGPLKWKDTTPGEFASFVVLELGPSVRQMRERAAHYDELRETMRGGVERTTQMTTIFGSMVEAAPTVAAHLKEFQQSRSAGLRLAAIAILRAEPQPEELNWLAERLYNVDAERPFVGFQAAKALLEAAQRLGPEYLDLLEESLERARVLGEKLESDLDRLQVLATAELEVMKRRAARDEELDVTRLINQNCSIRGFSQVAITRNLLIFSTKSQRTWLTFTTVGVFCSLDNRPGGKKLFEVQWFQSLRDIDPDKVTAQSGVLRIGAQAGWLYSPRLFERQGLRTVVLEELKRANDFRGRAERFELL